MVINDAGVDLLTELPFGDEERSRLFATAVDAFPRRLGMDAEAVGLR